MSLNLPNIFKLKKNTKEAPAPPVAQKGASPSTSNAVPSIATNKQGAVSSSANSPKGQEQDHLAGGVLSVRVVETRSIPAGPAPYCVIEFDKNEIVINPEPTKSTTNHSFKHRAYFDVSRSAKVNITLWRKENGKENIVGSVGITPNIEDTTQKMVDEWYSLTQGKKTETVCGEIRVQISYTKNADKTLTVEKFDLLKVIGKGSFGKVMQVRKKDTGRIYAMKIIRKADIIERDEVEHTLAERNVLAQINNPFVVNLKFSFQNPEKLYLVLAFVNGGELFYHLQNEGKFDESRAKLYISELLLALEHLHEYNIIYRDLKPENILLDANGHIALCDFGLCKLNMSKGEKTNTFCGTPEYLAPELLNGEGYTTSVDWWTLGVLLYEMLTGLPPFYSEDVQEMYQKILHQTLTFPDYVTPKAVSLLTKLLDRDPTKRLGSNGAQEIKNHPFFDDMDWVKLVAKEYQMPFKPHISSEKDTSNFDEEFTRETALDSVVEDSHLSETLQQKFAGFTFNPENAHLNQGRDD